MQEQPAGDDQPVNFEVSYPDRDLDRVTSFFRPFTVIPIAIVLGTLSGFSSGPTDVGDTTVTIAVSGVGILFLPVLLMLVFRGKYPRWWFDWNLELQRFVNRVAAYALLMDDRYPSTCLLYTSPSPRDGLLSRMPSSA